VLALWSNPCCLSSATSRSLQWIVVCQAGVEFVVLDAAFALLFCHIWWCSRLTALLWRSTTLNLYRTFTQNCVKNLFLDEMAMNMICWCCLSEEARAKKKISDEIDKILMEEEKNLRKEFKLLLLGMFIYNDSKIKICLSVWNGENVLWMARALDHKLESKWPFKHFSVTIIRC